MKKVSSYAFAIAFAVLYPFFMISSSYSVNNSYFGFHSIFYIYIRYLLIILIMFVLIYLNRDNKKLLIYYIPVMLLITTAVIYTDYFVTRKLLYNYAYLLWLGVVFSTTNAGVFFGATFFTEEKLYRSFYRRFWISYMFMYLLILYVSFLREPNSLSSSLNLELGNGTMKFFKAVFNDPRNNLYTSLVCFGNIFILVPLPFIISAIKKPPVYISAIMGIMFPLIFEGYQYIFKCGNCDIDDVVLNYSGYILGLFIETVIYTNKIKDKSTKTE